MRKKLKVYCCNRKEMKVGCYCKQINVDYTLLVLAFSTLFYFTNNYVFNMIKEN